jgi:hypothetical protein
MLNLLPYSAKVNQLGLLPSKQNFQKRDKPTCTHCGFVGHTVDKCYKVHGYPPGYRTRGKGPMANQVSHSTPSSNAMAVNEEISPFQLSQLQAQCQQILVVLNTKPSPSNTPETSNPNVPYHALANTASASSLPVHSMSGSFLYKSLYLVQTTLHPIFHIQSLLLM